MLRKSRLLSIKAVFLLVFSLSTGIAQAEGIYQLGTGLNQPLRSTTDLFVHVASAGDIIRVHLCRTDLDTNAVNVDFLDTTIDSDGVYTKANLLSTQSSSAANISCSDDMTTALPKTPATGELIEYAVPSAGVYALSLDDSGSISYQRWDVSVVPSSTPDASVDATANDGNLFSYQWRFIPTASGGDKSEGTSSNIYALVPGGFTNTDYVWQIDLNEFSGSGYDVVANNIGLNSPFSGTSATIVDGTALPLYPIYLTYPTGAAPSAAPSSSPALVGSFDFTDNADVDNGFSPDGDGTEDSGSFTFTSDVKGTYAITIDVNNDGLFNAGDRILSGAMQANTLTSVDWDGTDATGNVILNGIYSVQLELRVGEFHFVASDAETSGGGSNDDGSIFEGGTGTDDGLTILQATDSTTTGTLVYWDDATQLSGASNVPDGALSSTAVSGSHRHTWGDFTGAGIGDANLIDTYVYGNASTSTTTLIVAANNTIPTLSDETFSIDENSALNSVVGTVTSADADGDFLTHTITAGNTDNAFAIDSSSGQITVNGNLDADTLAQYLLTVQVTDQANSVSATITIDINDLNEAPTITGTPSTSINQDGNYLFQPTGYDDDGDALTYSITNQPSWSTFDPADGTLSGTPTNDDVGSYNGIQISVSSAGPLTADLTSFNIEVVNVNDLPIANDDVTSTDEDTAVLIDVMANDTEIDVGDTLSITNISAVINGVATISGNQVEFTPATNFNGAASFVYTINDGTVSDSASVTITVNAINDAPTISGSPATSVVQDASYSFVPTANDVDNDPLTFSISNAPAWADFDTATGALTGIPSNTDVGDYTNIIITVSSNGALADSLPAFSINVSNVNDAPVAVDDAVSTDEDITLVVDVLANDSDPDSDAMSVLSTSSVINGTVVINANKIEFTPTTDFNGSGSFSYTVSDGTLTDTANVVVTINAINDSPTIDGTPSTSVLQDSLYSFTPSANDVDGDALTFSILNKPTWATFDTANGNLSGTPTNDDLGDYANIQITVTSNGDLSDTLPAFTITVDNTNDAPIANDDSITIDEDIVTSIDVLANDTDIDVGDTLAISSLSSVVNGTASIVNNQISFTPTANFSGTASLTYTMTDGAISDSATVSITINSVNDAPTISGTPPTSVDQDASYSFLPTANDVENDSLTFSIANRPSWATFSTVNGSLSGVPTNDDVGVYGNIQISVSDAALTTTLTSFSITVINKNESPVANNDSVTTDEDNGVTIDVLANDTDTDVGDVLNIIALSNVTNGSASIVANQIQFTPNSNFNGTASLVYTVNDGTVSANATVTITVNSINDAPTISGNPSTTVVQDTSYSFKPTANDVDNDPLTFSITNAPGWAAFNTSDGTLSGTPTNDNIGIYPNIIISVSSAGSLTDALPAFTLTVENINDAPVANDDTVATDEDVAITINVLANDTDSDVGDSVSITSLSSVVGGTAVINAGQVLFTPTQDLNGIGSFSYTISDGVLTDTANVTITINSVNDAPIISGTPTTSVLQDNLYSFTPSASDADNDALTFSISNQPSWATFDTSNGKLTGTPTNADLGSYGNIIISVSSNGSLTDSLPAFTITVDNTNDLPVANNDNVTTDEDAAITIDVLANDTDIDINDTLVITNVSSVVNGTAAIVNNQVIYTPDENFNGSGSFLYTLTDGTVSDTANVTVTINSINDRPTISGIPSASVDQDVAYLFTPSSNDIENDSLSFSIVNKPNWAAFNTNNGSLTGTPTNTDTGSYANIQISVSDGSLSSTLTAFAITVNNINDAPIANDDVISTDEDNSINIAILVNDSDPDGDLLTVDSATATNGTTQIKNDGTIDYIPNANFAGADTISYTISDGNGKTATASVSITVNSVNDVPVAQDDISSITEGQSSTVNVLANDSDADNDTLTISSAGVNNGTVVINPDNTLTYTPLSTFLGTENVSYSISDGNGGTAAATLAVTVSPIVIAISGTPESIVLEENLYSFTPSVSASSNVTYTFSITNLPSWASFDNQTGNLSGTPVRADIATSASIDLCVDDTYNIACLTAFTIEVKGDLDQDGIADDADDDIDGDGMSNDWETDNGLDPYDPADANQDADGDGISNLDEFNQGSNPNSDDNPPSLTLPADIVVDATELLNLIDLGSASAIDYVNGVAEDCCDISNDAPERFAPGRTLVNWTAVDAANNETTLVQTVDVNPLVSFGQDFSVAEGETVHLDIHLNGKAPEYPMNIGYAVTGGSATEGEDFDTLSGTLLLNEGSEGEIEFQIVTDAIDEGDEDISIELDSGLNLGEKTSITITISEDNLAPKTSLSATQNSAEVIEVGINLGDVVVSANAIDPNSADQLSFDWSATDNRLTDSDAQDNSFTFDPNGLALGVYRLSLTVTDDGNPQLGDNSFIDLKVVNTPDNTENGLPCHVAPHKSAVTNGFLVESETGSCLNRGQYSLLSEGGGVLLNANDFTAQSALMDDSHTTTGGRFDFNIQDLVAQGNQMAVVIPLREAIPSDPLMRLFDHGTWKDFDTAGNDAIFSAGGFIGYCPSPFDAQYVAGLIPGNICVMLLITDGDSNDLDNTANRSIEFTGGVHQKVVPPPPPTTTPTTSSDGGGGAIYWLTLFVLFLGYKRRVG